MRSNILILIMLLYPMWHVGEGLEDQIVKFDHNVEPAAVCPAGMDIGYELVERYLFSAGYADARQEAGTSGISPDQIRLLVDGEDDDACEGLNATYGQYRNGTVRDVAYYEAGGYYFVAHPLTKREVDGMYIASGHHFFYVVNSDFERLQAYMM